MKQDSLDRLIGRMFIFGLQAEAVTADFAAWYRQYPAGGIILFRRNCRDTMQVKRLTVDLRALCQESHPDEPLLIGVDQEGGSLSPLRGLVTSLPGNMGLAATRDPEAAYFAGYTTGCELATLGINLNFAPVLDRAGELNPVIGTRAFSDNPAVVAHFGAELARGLVDGGVLFAAKHFPGHGRCSEDSHVAVPTCSASLETIAGCDVVPFREAIRVEGAAVMMAHVRYPLIDPVYPASLSNAMYRYIRCGLQFDGVLATDCLEMAAVQQVVPFPDDAVRAVEAGCDLVVISHTPEHQEQSFRALREAVRSGRIGVGRIEESARRISEWTQRLGQRTFPRTDLSGWNENALAEKSLTLVVGRQAWRFGGEPVVLLTPDDQHATLAEDSGDIETLGDALAGCGTPYRRIRCTADPGAPEILNVEAGIQPGERVVFVLSHPHRAPGQIELIDRLAQKCPVLLICTRDPREVAAAGLTLPVVYTYSTEPAVLGALARVLSGRAQAGGKLPLTLETVQ